MAAASRTGGVLSSRLLKNCSSKDLASALKQTVNAISNTWHRAAKSISSSKDKTIEPPKMFCMDWTKYLPTYKIYGNDKSWMETAVTDMVCNVNSLLTLHSLDSDLSHHLSTLHHDYDAATFIRKIRYCNMTTYDFPASSIVSLTRWETFQPVS